MSLRRRKDGGLDRGVRVVDLARHSPDPAATASIEAALARRYCVIPLRYEGERLVLAMADPTDATAIDEVAARTGVVVEPAMARRQDIMAAIEDVYGAAVPRSAPAKAEGNGGKKAAPKAGPKAAKPAPRSAPAPDRPQRTTRRAAPEAPAPRGEAKKSRPPARPIEEDVMPEKQRTMEDTRDRPAPVVRLGLDERGEALDLHALFEEVVSRGASDLHLTNGTHPLVRVDGDLMPLTDYPVLDPDTLRRMIYGMLSQKQRDRFEEELELDFSYSLPSGHRFRVNVYVQRGVLGAAFRLVPQEIRTVEDLGVPARVEEFARLPRGLVVMTGPTGSGKSTTLAALVDVVNRERPSHIMTVEDPIEFVHTHKRAMINQREVGGDTHGFANALKHVLRQDPDVILVGEMRDMETISMAVTAAETGHLVFATLHTQDAAQTVDRIIDVFPPHQQQQIRVQLSGSLMGVVAQQLLRNREGGGRTVACEVLVVTPAVRNLIREGKSHQLYSVMQAGGQFGMQTMDAALAHLTKTGRVAYDVAKERCHNAEEFTRLAGVARGHAKG